MKPPTCENCSCVHGDCLDNSTCDCHRGWSGTYCNVSDTGSTSPAFHGICTNDTDICGCYSGFSGAECSIRPPSSCTFEPVQSLSSNFDPSLTFSINNSTFIFTVTAPLEDSPFINPSENDTITTVPPYSLQSEIIFGSGSECDYPSLLWDKQVTNCRDTWVQRLPWRTIRDQCGFSDPDGDFVFTQNMKISRKYQLTDSQERTEQVIREISIA